MDAEELLQRYSIGERDFTSLDFTCIKLRKAYLVGINFSESNLSQADLIGANLTDANLTRVNLAGANISETNFSGANLNQVTFSKATMAVGTNFQNSNLRDSIAFYSIRGNFIFFQNTILPNGRVEVGPYTFYG